jgi:tRNA(Ile)-lysidine synthase
LRHEFIPFLETYNPNIQTAIWRMSQTLAGDQEVVDGVIQKAWDECVRQKGEGYVALSIPDFLSQPKGIQRGLFRKAISRIRLGLRDIDFGVVERGIAAAANPTNSQRIDLTAGLCLLTEADVVWIAAWEADLPTFYWPQITGEELELVIPGTTDLGDGWHVQADQVEISKLERSRALKNDNPYHAWMDADQLGHPLYIRRRRSGDRFQPLGMGGQSKKLADFFINVKIPRRARDAWPLVCTNETIHWIPGYRQSHQSRITEQSQELLALRMEKVSE